MKNINSKLISGLLLGAICIVPFSVWAINNISTGFRTTTSDVEIDAHNTCQNVRHTGSTSYFIPTKISSEWLEFRNNVPNDVELSSCVPVCNGVIDGGFCYELADFGQDCDNYCSNKGGCNLVALQRFDGSSNYLGALNSCEQILSNFGVNTNTSGFAGHPGNGCHAFVNFGTPSSSITIANAGVEVNYSPFPVSCSYTAPPGFAPLNTAPLCSCNN